MTFYRWENQDLILSVHLQPRASQTGIVGVHGDKLKVKVTAHHIEGQANEEVCKLFSKIFGVAKSQVILLRGENSKNKLFRIQSPKKWPDLIVASHIF
jgi:uncharacterized protein